MPLAITHAQVRTEMRLIPSERGLDFAVSLTWSAFFFLASGSGEPVMTSPFIIYMSQFLTSSPRALGVVHRTTGARNELSHDFGQPLPPAEQY